MQRRNSTKIGPCKLSTRLTLWGRSIGRLQTLWPSALSSRVRAWPSLLGGRAEGRATAEFQKLIDHPGMVLNFPLGALARLGLARAYAMQSDNAKAKAAYQNFLTLWKDADPDIPILKEAKAEYARLQ